MGFLVTQQERHRNDALDGLRGLAVLLVFFSHSSMIHRDVIPGLDFSGAGKIGVYLFFVLSAYLLTWPFLKEGRPAFRSQFLLNFGLRRFLRIFPLYTLVLLFALGLSLASVALFNTDGPRGLPITLTIREFWDHLLLQQGKGVMWSIVAEFKYYLLLPLVAWVFTVVLKARFWVCALVTGAFLGVLWFLGIVVTPLPNDTRVVPYLPVFLTGSLLAVAQVAWDRQSATRKSAFLPVVRIVGLVSLLVVIALIPAVLKALAERGVDFHASLYDHVFWWGVLFCAVVFAAVNDKAFTASLFEWSFLRYLGKISFSVYLWHIAVIVGVKELSTRISDSHHYWEVWLSCGLTLLICHISYRLIEQPFSRYRVVETADESGFGRFGVSKTAAIPARSST